MKRDPHRIMTSHVGSLTRPHDLLDMMKARLTGEGEVIDETAYQARVSEAVKEVVEKQVDSGIDFVTDGELSKAGFFVYVKERLSGFEGRPEEKYELYTAEQNAFPEYYADYFARAMTGGMVAPIVKIFAVEDITYVGEEALEQDIGNLKSAVKAAGAEGAFIPSIAPGGIGFNDYYKDDEHKN